MAQSMSPTSLFDRIESLRKWQIEQQQRLLQQQSQQSQFLSHEHKRMYEALNIQSTESEYSDEEIQKVCDSSKDLDNIPIKSPQKDFSELLEEKLNEIEIPVVTNEGKPKRTFLKKGTGLSRFRMTINDLAHKKPKPKLILNKSKPVKNKIKTNVKSQPLKINDVKSHKKISKVSEHSPLKINDVELNRKTFKKIPNVNYIEPKAVWKSISEENPTNYEDLLAELIEVRHKNPSIFDSPLINKSAENDQRIFEKELMDELKIFEVLEQNAANSSFCSTSSLVTRLMEHSVKSTPVKQKFALQKQIIAEIGEKNTPPKRVVSFSEPILIENSDSDTDTESDVSSVNSIDVCDLSPKKITKDVAVNTDFPQINSELLKSRLEELETELATFRTENARISKLKSTLEVDSRNLEKRKRNLDKELEEQRQMMKAQMDEEKAKLAKDRAIYDRYIREIKDGKTARQKDREELSILRSKLSTVEEELKLKESKWGATQARIRSQLKHLEKENASLRTENNELRTKNGKLEASNKQLLSRRPTETKVLHEINKNLSKLTLESKEKTQNSDRRKSQEKSENPKRKPRTSTSNQNNIPEKTLYFTDPENKENNNSLSASNDSKSSTERSFDSIEREYEKIFGNTSENDKLPIAEASSYSDVSCRREEKILDDGSVQIVYPNGNVRVISADGKMIVMNYHNGDMKETCKETGVIKYLYADAKTWHTTFPDGLEVLEFANGQTEKRFANGSTEIQFPNGCRRCISPGGSEEVAFPDGTLLQTRQDSSEKILTLPNGQREIHTKDHKRREYPDGTVKLLYPDGVQETRYANGRIRLKDKQGNLIMDSATV